MQRKNSILKNSRSAIAMLMAIGVIVIIGTIMALSISMTSQTSKRTKDLYIYEQAVLYSKSATEYALLRISRDNNSTNPCTFLGTNFMKDYYNINIIARYVYTSIPAGCPANTIVVTTPDQNGSVILDVAVSVTDTSITSEPIRYFRRTLQKL